MRAHERLLKYIQYDTTSCEACPDCPSTPGQRVLSEALAQELREMGAQNVRVDGHGYLYAEIPENRAGQPSIGLIAHVDTVDDVPALPMNARIVENYDGGEIVLNEEGVSLTPEEFPSLSRYVGQDIIVTDGRTLLGADDKAGVAEIMTLCERLIAHPEIPHGRVAIGFTPDEEIGRGADLFDVAGFGADFAYTVDGGELGGIEYENFNAASAKITVHGLNIHPGSAKDKMKNASLIAVEFASMLPAAETPAHTERYEGFYHLTGMQGSEETAELRYILRDHDAAKLEARKARMHAIAAFLNGVYGEGTVEAEVRDSYRNMREVMEDHMDVVERAVEAMRAAGATPVVEPIRGGTDGANLSFKGLPCPNLSTGGMNFHGRKECIPVQSMDAMVDVLEQLVRAR